MSADKKYIEERDQWLKLAKKICIDPLLAADQLKYRRDVGDRDREYFDNHPMNIGLDALQKYCDTAEERIQAQVEKFRALDK